MVIGPPIEAMPKWLLDYHAFSGLLGLLTPDRIIVKNQRFERAGTVGNSTCLVSALAAHSPFPSSMVAEAISAHGEGFGGGHN